MKYGKDREGLFPGSEDKTHVNDVETDSDNKVILSADDFGLVNLFHWPNPDSKISRSYCGHSEHVTRVMLSDNQ